MGGADIPDHFEAFDEEARVLTLRYFSGMPEAHLYATRLRAAGVRCFLSNVNTMTALPLYQEGIGLQVHEEDAIAADRMMSLLDQQIREAPEHFSFHDADLEDIEFQRQLHHGRDRTFDRLYWIVLVFILLLLLRAFLRAAGLVNARWDFF